MEHFEFRTDEKAEAFCLSIASEMVHLFGISEAEAVRRISKFWAHLSEIAGQDDLVYHEDEDYWANTIYYGPDSFWWLPSDLRDKRWMPPLSAQQID